MMEDWIRFMKYELYNKPRSEWDETYWIPITIYSH